MSSITLRPYQEDGVQAIRDGFRLHPRILFALATGGGKTVTFSHIAKQATEKRKRVVIVAHRREIVDQIARALTEMGIAHGLILPGRTMTDDPVQVGMVQTLAKRLDRIPEPDLLIIDEAHHAVTGSYQKVTDRWKRSKALGVTATPERLDGRGMKERFDLLVPGPPMRWLIDQGHLAAYDYYAPPSPEELSSVRSRGGDFAVDEIAAVMDRAVITGSALGHYREIMPGKPAIAFCTTVKHSEHVAEQFTRAGYRAKSIDGSMPAKQRRQLLTDLAEGRLHVLTSCELISEGVDVPVCAGAILLRPTKSLALYLQQVGRALRKKPDGSRAIILDHVGNVHRFGMPDVEREWTLEGRKKRPAAAPSLTTCPTCFRAVPSSQAKEVGASCAGVGGTPCPLRKPVAGAPRTVEVVAGRLEQVTEIHPWAKGIDIVKANGAALHRLIDLAEGNEDRLRAIQKARNYDHRWVKHAMADYGRIQNEVRILLAQASATGPELSEVRPDVLWSLIRKVDEAIQGKPTPVLAGMRYWVALRRRAHAELMRRKAAA